MKAITKNILKYLIEFIIVAFGVFLGVYVGEWNAQKKKDENTEKTMAFIIDELDTNQKKLVDAIAYHEKLIPAIDSTMNELSTEDFESIFYKNKKFRFNNLPGWRGLGFPEFEDIMYESAKINGVIQELNISTTKLIARAYQIQKAYTDFNQSLSDQLIGINSGTKLADVLAIFELLKYDALSTEKWLSKELKETKNILMRIKNEKSYKQ